MSSNLSEIASRILEYKIYLLPPYAKRLIYAFQRKHSQIDEFLDYRTGEQVYDYMYEYTMVNVTRTKEEQLAFVISKLQDPTVLAVAKSYCALVEETIMDCIC